MAIVPVNIALGCPCRQSSVDPAEQANPAGANDAVNGARTGHAAFTTLKEAAPWWQVDLGQDTALDSLVVYNWDRVDLPYAAAGRHRARLLQVWGSHDGAAWELLHDRRTAHEPVDDFGGIHMGPLCIPLAPARCRHLRLTLAGGGVLQLDEVQVYALREREPDDAIRDLLACAADLSFAMARRILGALALPLRDLPGHVARLGIAPGPFATVFLAGLLVEAHHGDAARTLLGQAAGPAPRAADPAFLSIDLPAHAGAHADPRLRDPLAVPPMALPLPSDGAWRLLDIRVGAQDIVYLLHGREARLLRQGDVLYAPAVLEALLAALFTRHPALERVVAADVMEAAGTHGNGEHVVTGRTDVLDLPSSSDEYRLAYIAPDLLAAIEERQRRYPQLGLDTVAAAGLDAAAYDAALRPVIDQAPALANTDWTALQGYAHIATLSDGTTALARALWLAWGDRAHVLACVALTDAEAGLEDVLRLRLVDDLLRRGVRHLHLPHRAGAGNILFGALGQPLSTLLFRRKDTGTMQDRVRAALASGETPAGIEADAEASLERLLGTRFEATLQVDFDAIVENDALGTDNDARRYQPTIRDAFVMMMRHVPFRAGEPFVDVGSGKGKMLYYASQLGYRDCIGMEISAMLLARARANFERLRLPSRIRLWQRDARALDLAELGGLSLFYLANPFGAEVMNDFLARLVESQRLAPRVLRIVYCVAMAEGPFATYGFEPVKVFEQGVDGWRFPRSVIYERRPGG